MTPTSNVPSQEQLKDLGDAFRQYATLLTARPQAKQFLRLIDRADETTSCWDWARILSAWPTWQPLRLERRLFLPEPSTLSALSARCRNAASNGDARSTRRWPLFGKSENDATNRDELVSLLLACAKQLEEIATEPPAEWTKTASRAVDFARGLDASIRSLPDSWSAVRLARAGEPLADDWPSGAEELSEEFTPLLRHLIQGVLTDSAGRPLEELFCSIAAELAIDLASSDEPLATALGQVGSSMDTGSIARMIEAFRASQAAVLKTPQRTDGLVEFARLGSRALALLVPNLLPPLDPTSLTVASQYRPSPETADIHYQVADRAPRSLICVDRFAVAPDRPKITVSLGASVGSPFAMLLAPRVDELPELPSGDWQKLLADSRQQTEKAFWSESTSPSNDTSKRTGWTEWLDTEAGAEWFDALARKALAEKPARQLLIALSARLNLRTFPAIDPETGSVSWPTDTSICQAGTTFDSAIDSFDVVRVERFARSPSAARFTVGSGPTGGPRNTAAAVWNTIAKWSTPTSVGPALEASIRRDEPPTSESLAGLLDALVQWDKQPPSEYQPDDLLLRIRSWAFTGEWSILPSDWEYRRGATWPGDVPGLTGKPVFRPADPVGQVFRVRSFGIARMDEIVRSAEVVVSAGPAPARLPDLEAVAERLPGDPGDRLRVALANLRPAGLGGYLEQAIVDMYIEFWDHAHAIWVDSDPASAAGFAETLRSSLRETFGLSEFLPLGFCDHPDGWVAVPPGTRMTTGRVVRVLRPGLLDAELRLRVPARAEVE